MSEYTDFQQDMDQRCDQAYYAQIEEREHELELALRRVLSHTSTEKDHQLIVAFCGMTQRIYGVKR